MTKIRIAYIMTHCSRGGPNNVVLNIINNLDTDRFECYLVSTAPENEKRSILGDFIKNSVKHYYVPLTITQVLLGNLSELKRVLSEINADVIHTTGTIPDLAITRICPSKQLIIAHSAAKQDNVLRYGKIIGNIMAVTNVRLYKRARVCVACSESLSNYYKTYGLTLPYIRNGVTVPDVQPFADKEHLRKELGLPKNKRIFIYCASFTSRKNHRVLVEAFKEMIHEDVLLLLGDGGTKEELERTYETDNIIFAGRKADVTPYLFASDFYISSSLYEGMPMGVLEGMACGLPVLLSDIDQHREIWDLNNDIGLLFSNESMDSLYDAYQRLALEDYSTLSKQSFETASYYFNAKTMSKSYQQEYLKIASFTSGRENR